MSSSKVSRGGSGEASGEDVEQCMAALVRVITYARDEAKRLEASVLAFCLDAAIAAAAQEPSKPRLAARQRGNRAGGQKKAAVAPIH